MLWLDKFYCWLGWHNWDRYSGFYEERVHPDAKCRRCGYKYKWLKENK